MLFKRKAIVQAKDEFNQKDDLGEIDTFIRSQKVPGELVVSYPGNGGRTSVVFNGKPQVYRGEVGTLQESLDSKEVTQ